MGKFVKMYPHQKLIAAKRLKLAEMDEYIQEQIASFDEHAAGPWQEKYQQLSEEIVEAIQAWLDREEMEESIDDPEPATGVPATVPATGVLATGVPAAKPASSGLDASKLNANNRALLQLWEAGQTSNLTRQDLAKAGFNTGFWTTPLTNKGYKSPFFTLIRKSLREEIYSLHLNKNN